MINKLRDRKRLTAIMRTAIVKILHKKNDRQEIGNYRPLSLLCVDYKALAKLTTERIKPVLTQVIGNEQQGFVIGGDISGNLILVKEIIEYCKAENVEAYMILMDFMKAYDRVDRYAMEQTIEKMNFPQTIIDLISLLYTDAEAIVVINDELGQRFSTHGGVRQGCPLSPYLFIIVLELMALEMKDDETIEGVKIAAARTREITSKITTIIRSLSHKQTQGENEDDRLSMFADDSATFVTAPDQILPARINIGAFEGGTTAALHELKTKIMRLGPAATKTLTKTDTQVKFIIMEDKETEKYLGDIIGNNVTEDDTFGHLLESVEKLGNRWLKEHIGIYGRTIVANSLMQAKLSHRASVNAISPRMESKMRKIFKAFMWGGPDKRPRLKWGILLLPEKEGGTGLKDPILTLDAAKITILKRLITRNRQPWMRWVERKLHRVAQRWGVEEAMAATPSKRQIKSLHTTCLVESTLALWHEIGGSKKPERMVATTHPDTSVTMEWESGFGVQHKDNWHTIEAIKTNTIYSILLEKRYKLKNYTPKEAHTNINKIKCYLTPEERHFWWKLTHKTVSIKKTESKYKRDKCDNLVSAECPLCHHQEETRIHYEYECLPLMRFRRHIAQLLGKQDLTYDEWMLEKTQGPEAMLLIAKARWAFHCERCNIDHKRRQRFNMEVVLTRTQRRVLTAIKTIKQAPGLTTER